ncbi:MAG: hypothetical protein KDK10_02845 [Maritimibacter sp.]|nr:hypothetical protein [Maritimibacter sp.]
MKIALLAAALSLAAPLRAETLDVASPQLALAVDEPAFTATRGKLDFADTGTGPDGAPYVIHEVIPADETFEDWKTLFAVFIEDDLALDFQAYVGQVVRVYYLSCVDEPDIQVLGSSGDTALDLTIYCRAYRDDPSTGELAQFALRRSGDDFARVYQHWRLPSDTDLGPWMTERIPEFSHFWDAARALTLTEID